MDPQNRHSQDREMTRKNARTGLIVLAVVAGMLGLSFAAVPLYRLFCQVTGFNGTTQTAASLPEKTLERSVSIRFNADTNRNLPWDFKPLEHEITLRLGQRGLTAYQARNRSAVPTGGTAIYNVTPLKAGKYFHKIQCFCFDEQILQAGQSVDMPVMFFVDPAMDEDPAMDDVTVITLSYTFYSSDSKPLEQALEAFYNSDKTGINNELNH